MLAFLITSVRAVTFIFILYLSACIVYDKALISDPIPNLICFLFETITEIVASLVKKTSALISHIGLSGLSVAATQHDERLANKIHNKE